MTDQTPGAQQLRSEAGPFFGEFGGRYMPESLIAALDEVQRAYEDAQQDPEFAAELAELHRTYTGRPSIVTEVPRFAAHAGNARILLKREDLNHTGSHKINNVLGQALLVKRLGKTRLIAETGAGQHGVATATAAALFGMECTVYMGEVDTERQALNVARMRLLGAEVIPVKTGSRTLKDAINEAFRDWVANVDHTHYLLGTVNGPHPFPVMVRDFHKIIGEEARDQVLELTGRLPDAVAACVGGARTRSGSSMPSSTIPMSHSTGSSRADTASPRASTARRSAPGSQACCTARAPTCSKTKTGRRWSRTPSPPVSTTRVSVPSTPGSPTSVARPTNR